MIEKQKNLIIFGDSAYAEMISHYFQTDSEYEVVAFCVDREYRTRNSINDLPVIALEEIENHYSANDHYMFAAIGYTNVRTHKTLFQKIEALPFKIASYTSSQAIIDRTCTIGDNCLILPGVILEPHVIIEKNCFLNSGVTICHHAKIKAHSVLAAKSLIGGYVTVGESSLIGFHATVTELLNVAEETLLAAGSVLLHDTEPCTMYAGTPAKSVRQHTETGILLKTKNTNL